MSDHYLYEFLYRGRPAGDAEPPAWHVVIGQMVQMPGRLGGAIRLQRPLTPAQAEAAAIRSRRCWTASTRRRSPAGMLRWRTLRPRAGSGTRPWRRRPEQRLSGILQWASAMRLRRRSRR